MDDLFSTEDRQQIAAAIEEAEAASSAEIVPYVVVQSDNYPAARWRGGVLGALLALSLVALLRGMAVPDLAPYLSDGIALFAALGFGILGAVGATAFPPLVRALTPPDELQRTVSRRALEAFVDEEVFDTRDRTGILLFVSLAEHRIEILADRGIDEQVDDTAWTDVTDHIRRGIEADRLTQGLLQGIERCGSLLDKHGLAPGPGDQDELSDELRHEKR